MHLERRGPMALPLAFTSESRMKYPARPIVGWAGFRRVLRSNPTAQGPRMLPRGVCKLAPAVANMPDLYISFCLAQVTEDVPLGSSCNANYR